jgi:predicted RNA-binding Zn-ribbon protein involved in translation (DUF1610 family)
VLDHVVTLFGMRPWRCGTCESRFHAARVALSFSRYAHCPRCGNFDLERIAPDRVNWGLFVGSKRWLGFPAYRCDPCRKKFFSVLRYRRIVPSTLPAQAPGIDPVYNSAPKQSKSA